MIAKTVGGGTANNESFDSDSADQSFTQKVLDIKKGNCKMREIPYDIRMESAGNKQHVVYGILGVVNIEGYNYMVAITDK